MSSRHDGVSCDACGVSNFPGLRHKCLRCIDFDLCHTCARDGAEPGTHRATHQMQTIPTAGDLAAAIQAAEEAGKGRVSTAYACSLCPEGPFSAENLMSHVVSRHAGDSWLDGLDDDAPVLCSICAMDPRCSGNEPVSDLLGHMLAKHARSLGGPRASKQRSHRPRKSPAATRDVFELSSSTDSWSRGAAANELASLMRSAVRLPASSMFGADSPLLERTLSRQSKSLSRARPFSTSKTSKALDEAFGVDLDVPAPSAAASRDNATSWPLARTRRSSSACLTSEDKVSAHRRRADRSQFVQQLLFGSLVARPCRAEQPAADEARPSQG